MPAPFFCIRLVSYKLDQFKPGRSASVGGDNASLMAANLPSLNMGRSIFIEKVTKGKFIIKSCGEDDELLTVVGKGGRNKSTGELKEGFYYAIVKTSDAEYSACVDNETQEVVADSNCSDISGIADGSLDVAAYMELSAEEAEDLKGFTTILGASGQLTTDQCPTGYEDKDWPAKILITD